MGNTSTVIANTRAAIEVKEFHGHQIEDHEKHYWGEAVNVKAGKKWRVPARDYREKFKYVDEGANLEIHCRGKSTGKKLYADDFIKFEEITVTEKEICSIEGVRQYAYDLHYKARGNNCDNAKAENEGLKEEVAATTPRVSEAHHNIKDAMTRLGLVEAELAATKRSIATLEAELARLGLVEAELAATKRSIATLEAEFAQAKTAAVDAYNKKSGNQD